MLYKDQNQIKRNYYLNLFSANAEIKKSPYSIASVSGSVGGNGNQNQNQNQNGGGGNGNQNQNQNQNQGGDGTSTGNNWIYEWNIRDLQLERYAEIALVQIANNNADYTEERQYPSKLWTSIDASPTTITYNSLPAYVLNFSLNTTNITHGSGEYTITFSNKFTIVSTEYPNSFADNLFDYITNTANENAGVFLNTNIVGFNSSGNYIGTRYLAETDYKGEWFFLKLPVQIFLTKIAVIGNGTYVIRNPALWRIYGSNDGTNWEEIIEGRQATRLVSTDYSNNSFTINKIISTQTKLYNHIGMNINAIISGQELGFIEFQIFGREKIAKTKIISGLTEQREYPPKLFNSSTSQTTSSSELINVLPSTYIKETITLNTTGITYGSGVYEMYYSSTVGGNRMKNIINKNYSDTNAQWGANQFNGTTGYYNYPTVANYLVNNYLGDWIVFKLPSPIILTMFRFYHVSSVSLQGRSPSLWYCHVSNDAINWVEIEAASNADNPLTYGSYVNNMYEKVVSPAPTIAYRYIAFTFNKLIGSGSSTWNVLNFAEIQLFGKEETLLSIEQKNIYTIRTHNCYNDGYDSQNTTNAMLYMSNELTSPKQPTYHKLNTYNLNRITLEVNDDIEDKNRNGIDPNIEFGAVFHIKNYKDT